MNRLCRLMYAGRGLHGHQGSSELRLRGWALLQNFRPYAPRLSLPNRLYTEVQSSRFALLATGE
jgi:hypothetical protein